MSDFSAKTISILLIEDEPGDAYLFLTAMRRLAIRSTIVHVPTLGEARAWLGANRCDVILTDLSLPDSQGFSTIAALQQAAPWLPIIVLSANDDFDFALRAVQAGTQDFLVKGQADGPIILRAILYAIKRKELEADLRKARDEAEASTRAKAQFLAVMSHEIRTPMNGILGMTYLLLAERLPEPHREKVQLIRDSANSLLTILNDILDFSKLEADRMEVTNFTFDIRQTVANITALLSAKAQEQAIALETDIAPDVPKLVLGDSGRLRQLLLNLVGNAIKFTLKGKVALRIRVQKAAGGSGFANVVTLRFEVSDTGIGIAPDVIPALFTAFSQGDATVARRFGGTGLGLAICRKIVDRLGGEIGVESTPGRGSLFWFQLPFQKGREETTDPEAASDPAAARAPAKPLRVLVADDNPINQMVARAYLENSGHSASVVADGQGAIEAVRTGGFDIVLMDVHMPVMDGLAATRAIRALPKPYGDIPVIALTASAMAEEVETCRAAGMDGHIAKPVDPLALAAALERRYQGGGAAARKRPQPPEDAAAPDNPEDALPLLDDQRFNQLRTLMDDASMSELADHLILYGLAELDDLEAAVEAGDLAQARRIAHNIKGMFSNFGAEQVAALAFRLQNRDSAEALRPLVPVIRAAINQTARLLGRETRSSGACPGPDDPPYQL